MYNKDKSMEVSGADSCHGWQVLDLAHENISSAMDLLDVTAHAAANGETSGESLASSIRLISNLLKGSLPVIDPSFKTQPHVLVLAPSELLKAS